MIDPNLERELDREGDDEIDYWENVYDPSVDEEDDSDKGQEVRECTSLLLTSITTAMSRKLDKEVNYDV